jgi:dephospho-CoA kinase
MFRELGVPVLDADKVRAAQACVALRAQLGSSEGALPAHALPRQTVHDLYAPGGAAVGPVGAAFEDVVQAGAINRAELSKRVVGAANEAAMRALEAIVHPLVAASRAQFLDAAAAAGESLVVLDVPLLYETGVDSVCDAVAVVSTRDTAVQRARVLARPGMTADKLDGILARQLPDAEKCARAAFVVNTACAPEQTRQEVRSVVERCRAKRSVL